MSQLITEINGEVTVNIPETFAVEEASALREELYHLIHQGKKRFLLSFQNCKFIDSTGLGVMVAVYKKCIEQNGSFKVRGVNPQVMKVFQLTRLDKVFEISN